MKTIMLGSVPEGASGPLNNIIEQLLGKDTTNSKRWFDILKLTSRMSPRKILALLKSGNPNFWKVLTVGGSSKEKLIRTLMEAIWWFGWYGNPGIYLTPKAHDIASRRECKFSREVEEDVEFVRGSLAVLFGFKQNVSYSVFLKKEFLKKHGLALCKPSDAFYLLLSCVDKPAMDMCVRVGMTPIQDSDCHPMTFLLRQSRLNAAIADIHNNEQEWVFRRLVEE